MRHICMIFHYIVLNTPFSDDFSKIEFSEALMDNSSTQWLRPGRSFGCLNPTSVGRSQSLRWRSLITFAQLFQMGEVDIGGISTYHYEADSSVFSISNPHNFCYCPKASLLISSSSKMCRAYWYKEDSGSNGQMDKEWSISYNFHLMNWMSPTQAAKCAIENRSNDTWDLSNCRPPSHPITCKDGLFSTLGCQVRT